MRFNDSTTTRYLFSNDGRHEQQRFQMVPASCDNCDTPVSTSVHSNRPRQSCADFVWSFLALASHSSQTDSRHGSPNLGVVLGVLGGMALTAVLVFLCVPVLRRRTRSKHIAGVQAPLRSDDPGRQPWIDIGHGAPSRRKSSLMSSISRWRRFGNLGSGVAHSSYDPVREGEGEDNLDHHEKLVRGGGGDATGGEKRGALLPLLPEVSTFTWSDLRSSKGSSAQFADELDVADVYSLPTNDATFSHRSTGHSDRDSAPSDIHPYSVLDGHSGSAKRRRSTVRVSPSAKRNLNPSGLPPKTTSSPDCPEPYNLVQELLFLPT